MLAGYPAPRYPKYKRPKTVEELMPKARELVNQPPGHHPHSLKPSYNIKSGDRILFVVLSEYSPMIVEAMCRAMREKGARVDLLAKDSTPVAPAEELAAHEALSFGKEEGDYSYYFTMITNLIRFGTARAMVDLDKYDMIVAGSAGPPPKEAFPWHRLNFISLEDFASPLIDFPHELHHLINQKTWEQILSSKTIRVTDPEGTDVQWTNYDDERPYAENHLLARPLNIGYGFGGKDDCTGVIAGTLNHIGAFPHCKAYIEGGQVARVEGGGKYGQAWRELLAKYKDTMMPAFKVSPDKEAMYEIKDCGMFWYMECAVGTVPAVSRLPSEGMFKHYANCLHDRMRSGYVHHGLGPNMRRPQELIQAGLPWVHLHIHNMFATMEGKNERGETVSIIDKGHLTSLDDAEVKAVAKKYGDPARLLSEIWFPAVPGINAHGDYMKDYGQDPVAWMKKEAEANPIWLD